MNGFHSRLLEGQTYTIHSVTRPLNCLNAGNGVTRSIECHRCGRISYFPVDVEMKYCANCDFMHEEGRARNIDDVRRYNERRLNQERAERLCVIGIPPWEAIEGYPNPMTQDEVDWKRDGF